jgi:hypothetical protein
MTKHESFDHFWERYVRLHRRRGTRVMHACATASFLVCVTAGIALRLPWLIIVAPLVDFAIAQASHRLFERNKTRPWRAPLRHARAEWRLFRETVGLRERGRR